MNRYFILAPALTDSDYKNQYKNIVATPKVMIDASLQTGFERINGSSQTESHERRDFQAQVYLQEQGEPIPTQTESSEMCDFQVQTNIQQDSAPIPPLEPTIKQEIRMPNIPSSVAQTPAKKRKLSSVSTSSVTPTKRASIPESLPCQSISTSSGDQLSNEHDFVEPAVVDSSAPQDVSVPQSISNGTGNQAEVEDAIFNSEVYKIYCREKDPKEAMKKIKALKNCISFQRALPVFPAEKDFKRACETTLNRLWKLEPYSGDSKFEKIKKFLNEDINLTQLTKVGDKPHMGSIFQNCLTWIRMLHPNGYEFWYIANFEKGLGKSKWYRAESTIKFQDCMLARLNVMGITKSTISKLHYDHYMTKNSTKNEWLDFANDLIRHNGQHLVDVEGLESIDKGMILIYGISYIYTIYIPFFSEIWSPTETICPSIFLVVGI